MNNISENESSAAQLERLKRKRRIKRRLLPCILAGFSLPFTLFLYGPFDLLAQNRAEFAFSLYDFILPCILLTLAVGALLSAIPLLLRGRAYSLYLAVLFWASVMLFVQGSYLNFGMSSLAGDGITEGASVTVTVINTLIWVLTLAATVICVLCLKPVRKKLRTAVSLGVAIMLVMQATGIFAVSFGGVFDGKDRILGGENENASQKMLTFDGLTTLSEDRNIVIFIVDRFDAKYYRDARDHYPEIMSSLEGFTSFENYTSLYCRTFPAVTSIVTGVENDFSTTRFDYFDRAYADSPSLNYLSEKGYEINLYTDGFYAYNSASSMQSYTENVSAYSDYQIKNRAALFGSMLALSAYRYFPFVLKGTVDSISSTTFSSLVEYKSDQTQEKYNSDNRAVWQHISDASFSLGESKKQLSVIHISGCHMPTTYDSAWNDLGDNDWSVGNVMRQSFSIIERYIAEMKRLGIYEDSTVMITGDHAAAMTDKRPLEGARVTAMLVKPAGVSAGQMLFSQAPVSQRDLWATVFDCEGLDDAPSMGGVSFFDVPEDSTRERLYYFHLLTDGDDEEIVYKIVGDANSFSSWELTERRQIHNYYD